jgi:hypothetical protein
MHDQKGSVTMVAIIFHGLQGSQPAMLSWASILYDAALSAVVAGAALTALARPRQPAVILTGALATAVGPLAWNAILRATHASQFFTDAPYASCPPAGKTPAPASLPWPPPPSSWGSGRWPPPRPRRTIGLAVLCGLAAFLVDVYLY